MMLIRQPQLQERKVWQETCCFLTGFVNIFTHSPRLFSSFHFFERILRAKIADMLRLGGRLLLMAPPPPSSPTADPEPRRLPSPLPPATGTRPSPLGLATKENMASDEGRGGHGRGRGTLQSTRSSFFRPLRLHSLISLSVNTERRTRADCRGRASASAVKVQFTTAALEKRSDEQARSIGTSVASSQVRVRAGGADGPPY